MKKERGPYLYLFVEKDGSTQWLIFHGGKRIATAFSEQQQEEALAELEDYASNYKRLPKDWKPTTIIPRHAKRLFVYFISTDEVPKFPIKIGITDNLSLRLAGLQCGCPYKLKVIGAVQAVPSIERNLHIAFAQYRLSGEWFKRHRNLIKYIDDLIDGAPAVPVIRRGTARAA